MTKYSDMKAEEQHVELAMFLTSTAMSAQCFFDTYTAVPTAHTKKGLRNFLAFFQGFIEATLEDTDTPMRPILLLVSELIRTTIHNLPVSSSRSTTRKVKQDGGMPKKNSNDSKDDPSKITEIIQYVGAKFKKLPTLSLQSREQREASETRQQLIESMRKQVARLRASGRLADATLVQNDISAMLREATYFPQIPISALVMFYLYILAVAPKLLMSGLITIGTVPASMVTGAAAGIATSATTAVGNVLEKGMAFVKGTEANTTDAFEMGRNSSLSAAKGAAVFIPEFVTAATPDDFYTFVRLFMSVALIPILLIAVNYYNNMIVSSQIRASEQHTAATLRMQALRDKLKLNTGTHGLPLLANYKNFTEPQKEGANKVLKEVYEHFGIKEEDMNGKSAEEQIKVLRAAYKAEARKTHPNRSKAPAAAFVKMKEQYDKAVDILSRMRDYEEEVRKAAEAAADDVNAAAGVDDYGGGGRRRRTQRRTRSRRA
jgi:hypothetical protein